MQMTEQCTETDEVLYNRFLAEHHENDFRILLERHRESLVLFLYGFVHNMDDAEEIMLDAFAEAATGNAFSRKSFFKTWLFAIGKHLALMWIRKHRFSSCELTVENAGTVPPPDLDILKNEQNTQLYSALQRLNSDYRQILILLYFEEMSHEEAGKVMGKNKRQIYHLAERGRKALKDELERMGFEYAQY